MFKKIRAFLATNNQPATDFNAILQAVKFEIYQRLFDNQKESITENPTPTNQSNKKEIERITLNTVINIINADDALLANRHWLADIVQRMAKYGILLIPPEPENDHTGLRGQAGISGDISKHFNHVIETFFIEDLERYGNIERVRNKIYKRYWRANFELGIANTVRMGLEDYQTESALDWLRPFVISMYAWNESMIRHELKLPSKLDNTSPSGRLILEQVRAGNPTPIKIK